MTASVRVSQGVLLRSTGQDIIMESKSLLGRRCDFAGGKPECLYSVRKDTNCGNGVWHGREIGTEEEIHIGDGAKGFCGKRV